MKKILEIESIYNAFMDTILKKLPSSEKDYPDWYKARLEKCDSCKFNTKNIPNKFIPTGGLYFSKMMGKYRCSICTCFIRQKAWSRTEMCALGETKARPSWLTPDYLGDDKYAAPKWPRLELVTMKEDEFNVISTDGKRYNIDLSEDGSKFVIDLGGVNPGEILDFSFILESRHIIKISRINTSCGCTSVSLKILDPKHFESCLKINTSGFPCGTFTKQVRFNYFVDSGDSIGEEVVIFDIKGLINQKEYHG